MRGRWTVLGAATVAIGAAAIAIAVGADQDTNQRPLPPEASAVVDTSLGRTVGSGENLTIWRAPARDPQGKDCVVVGGPAVSPSITCGASDAEVAEHLDREGVTYTVYGDAAGRSEIALEFGPGTTSAVLDGIELPIKNGTAFASAKPGAAGKLVLVRDGHVRTVVLPLAKGAVKP